MKVQEEIKKHIAGQPEPKRTEMHQLHRLLLRAFPDGKLWFFDGKNSKNQIVTNPTIRYGTQTLRYADGTTKEWFRIGLSANNTGISVYVLGLKDKKHLSRAYGKQLGKASVTSYCIRFKTLRDINMGILDAAIRDGASTRLQEQRGEGAPT